MDTNIIASDSQDVPELAALVNSAYRGEKAKQGWTTEADLLDGTRTDEPALYEMLAQPGAVILKALNTDNKIMGCIYLKKKNVRLYIGMLAVSPAMQGAGTGKKLLKAAEEYALKNGCRSLTMTVISVRTVLIQWYERLGFRATGKTEPFPDDPRFGIPRQPLHFIVMEKRIMPGN